MPNNSKPFKVKHNQPFTQTATGKPILVKPNNEYSVTLHGFKVVDIPDYLEDARGMAELVADSLNKNSRTYSVDTAQRLLGKRRNGEGTICYTL